MKIPKFLPLLFIATLSFAQMKQSTFVLGPKVGLNATKVSILDNPTTIESKFRFDLNAGIYARLNLGKFSFQPEFLYQEKGGNFKEPDQQQSYQYLSTPIMLGYKPAKGINVVVGPEYSWALNADAENTERQIYGPHAKNDLAFVGGVRIDMLDFMSMFSLDLRYVHGLNNVTNRMSGTTPLDFRNRTIQLSISYNFSEYYKWWSKYGVKKNIFKAKK